MTKQLYEEALADVKRVKEVAQANAQRAIIEAVAPRIRDLIERELLGEAGDFDSDILSDDVVITPGVDASLESGVSPTVAVDPAASQAISTDDDGKVTLDIDALSADVAGAEVPAPLMGDTAMDDEFTLNAESVNALSPLLAATSRGANKELELRIYRFNEAINRYKSAGKLGRTSNRFSHEISQMISRVEDMYDHVQESVSDPAKKSLYESKLETYFTELKKLQEPMMSQNKKRLNEEDVTVKLTGLPDDVDLESVGVDLITGEEGEEGGDDLEGLDGGDEGGDFGGDDMGGDDMGDELALDDEEDGLGEALRLSDDTIVEIDAKMLRKEISRMRRLREEALPSTAGKKLSGAALDDFGGGCDEGDPLDQDIAHQSPAKAALPLGEADGDLDEGDDLDEADLAQIGDKRSRDDFGSSASSVPSGDKSNPAMRQESLRRRIVQERKLQENVSLKINRIKQQAVKARRSGNKRAFALLQREYAQVATRFNESVERENKMSKLFAESKKLQSGARLNGAPKQLAETQAVKSLRSKLSETNLINARLVYANKILQNESLSTSQKRSVIEKLKEAQTVREAKLVYESVQNVSNKKLVSESVDRKVLSSSSRASRPSATQTITESTEADRWAKLAGITK